MSCTLNVGRLASGRHVLVFGVNLNWTESQKSFRMATRQWLEDNRIWDEALPRFDDLEAEVAWLRSWQATLAAGGLIGVAWPEQFGGRGLGPAEHFIVQEELARIGSPELVGRIGLNLAAPTLMAHGTDEQRDRWLPGIRDASELWCQLFSEPDAGSDLASLKTRAQPVDGGWLVSGQKVWTSYAQFADWGLLLARTDPDSSGSRGISYFVTAMDSPGMTIRPLVQITGQAEFNEVFLDDVFVPEDALIGDPGQGWTVARSTLSHERGTSPRQLVKHIQLVEDLLDQADDATPWEDSILADRIASAYADIRIFQLHNLRSLSRLERGEEPGPEGSVLKLFWSERTRGLHDTLLDVLGAAAPLWHEAEGNPGSGDFQTSWLYYRAATIFGGTSEIQRNIIGERVLGLPREPGRDR